MRPQGDRLTDRRLVNIVFTADEGSRVYIERINLRGNTRTRDNVIRREFDVAEGDAYNRALVIAPERRLKNLNYFKSVKIVTEPGSTPDRIILNVDLEERSTGDLSLSGGFSTADGFLASVAITERNLLGMGIYSKAALSYGQRARSFEFSLVEPFLLGYRVSGGLDVFARQTFNSQYTSYETRTLGFSTRLGVSLREDLNVQFRYSLLRQEISVPAMLRNCNNVSPDSSLGLYPTPDRQATTIDPATALPFAMNCLADGEASIAVRSELARGPVITSLVGYTVNYNTLDNNINPTAGVLASISQDFAGVGGDTSFIRTNGDFKTYYELMSDLTALVRVQGGHIMGVWKPLRNVDHFQMGPNLVRGFAPSGIGPRDITAGSTLDGRGGSLYWGASLELQAPLSFLPKELGLRGAVFADAGSLMNYVGPTSFPATGEAYCATCINNSAVIRSSVGAGIVWDSPFGPLRFDYSWPLTKGPFDRVQQFRFGGGTTF